MMNTRSTKRDCTDDLLDDTDERRQPGNGDRFLNSMDEAMLTAGIHAFSSVFVLVEAAATNTEKNSGTLSSNSVLCFSNEKLSILSFGGDRKMLGFFFEHNATHSLSMSFRT